ncbi:MAG: hypothetical protein A2623_02945 [Caulobacterales bacterium RIFCSPHIGHO2_01_FULL_70_19]|nr:MAG: hypothetical protein A2623_02945 [Caulobacterales bacterium RIFCSPHIGHO2_01_FULL_70_19]
MPGRKPPAPFRAMRATPSRVSGSTSGVTIRTRPVVCPTSSDEIVADWPARTRFSSVSGTRASSSSRPSRTMRNSSVPAATIWPRVTLRLITSPDTGARSVACDSRVCVSASAARAAATLACEARWLARAVSSEAWLRKPRSFSSWARASAASSRAALASAVCTAACCCRTCARSRASFICTSGCPCRTYEPSSTSTEVAVRPPVSAPTGTSSQAEMVPEALIVRGRSCSTGATTVTVWPPAAAFSGAFSSPCPPQAASAPRPTVRARVARVRWMRKLMATLYPLGAGGGRRRRTRWDAVPAPGCHPLLNSVSRRPAKPGNGRLTSK